MHQQMNLWQLSSQFDIVLGVTGIGTDMTDEYFDEFSTRVFYNIILLKTDGLELENTQSNYIKIVSTLLGIKMCTNCEIL